ncbi:MAG: hypothetical protein ACRC2B_19555, partial [Rubrivivax sp.]
MMQRRTVIGSLLLGAIGSSPGAIAPTRTGRSVPLVGVLVATGLHPLDYLRQGLRAQGYVEGQSVDFAYRSADGNPRNLPGLARHLASL